MHIEFKLSENNANNLRFKSYLLIKHGMQKLNRCLHRGSLHLIRPMGLHSQLMDIWGWFLPPQPRRKLTFEKLGALWHVFLLTFLFFEVK